jgi:hypothetical protein
MTDRTPALPCFCCGTELLNVFPHSPHTIENQPDEGTEFRTRGHYGSTFWDDFDGQELILNVCDPCLRIRTERLGVQRTEVHSMRPYRAPEAPQADVIVGGGQIHQGSSTFFTLTPEEAP